MKNFFHMEKGDIEDIYIEDIYIEDIDIKQNLNFNIGKNDEQ